MKHSHVGLVLVVAMVALAACNGLPGDGGNDTDPSPDSPTDTETPADSEDSDEDDSGDDGDGQDPDDSGESETPDDGSDENGSDSDLDDSDPDDGDDGSEGGDSEPEPDPEPETPDESVTAGFEHDALERAASFFNLAGTLEIRFDDGETSASVSQSDPSLNDAGYLDSAPLSDPDEIDDPEPVPEFDYSTTVELDAQQFKAGVGAGSSLGGQPIRIAAADGTFETAPRVRGGGFDHATSVEATVTGPAVEHAFSSAFLSEIAAALPPTRTVTLSMGADTLARIETDHMTFVLMPRLMEDDP